MNADKTSIKDVCILREHDEILTAKEPRHVVLNPDRLSGKSLKPLVACGIVERRTTHKEVEGWKTKVT